jgi:hypothetical protein
MVKGSREGRQCSVGGRGVTPLIESMLERYNPQEEKKNVEQEQISMGDVVSMMRSF